jgi:hypothetical protein
LRFPSDKDVFEFEVGTDRLVEVELDGELNTELYERCIAKAPRDDDGDPDVLGWLRPNIVLGKADVMIGSVPLATIDIDDATRDFLIESWREGIITQGSVEFGKVQRVTTFSYWISGR